MGDAAPLDFPIPGWVPEYIARKARELNKKHRKSPIAVAVIERLTTDPKMKRVWNELAKQSRSPEPPHRSTGSLYKVAKRFEGIDQQAAITDLFEQAVRLGWLTLSLPQADDPARPFKELGKKLRAQADLLRNKCPFGIGDKLADHVLIAAVGCEDISVAACNPDENIAREIAAYLESVFGKPMFNTTATIASVITKKTVTPRKVRTWVSAFRLPIS